MIKGAVKGFGGGEKKLILQLYASSQEYYLNIN